MKCRKCGSRRITWEIDAGYVLQEYNETGETIDYDVHLDGLNSPQCAMCGSTDLED